MSVRIEQKSKTAKSPMKVTYEDDFDAKI